MTIGPYVYLDGAISELLRSPDPLQYPQGMSPPAAVDDRTPNSERPPCRLRRHDSQYVSQAYSCQQWWMVQLR
jgi:hypothetical protein